MAVTKSNIPARLAQTLVLDTSAAGAPENDIFVGVTLANKIYQVLIDNSAVGAATYVRAQYAATYTKTGGAVATSADDLRLYAPANKVVTYIFPEGLVFTTGLSVLATSDTSDTHTTAYTDPGDTVIVKILGGT
tara:strand:- start:215 stop:616 length:402 start_codon:yes stop_codon:yes gene_type:complete